MTTEKSIISCARCHAYLFPEDDVVYCPECGAPHHRDCYKTIGNCALAEFHGTPNQYDLIRENFTQAEEEEKEAPKSDNLASCPICHEKYDFSLDSCPKCKAPNFEKAGGRFAYFDFLGGVPSDYDIGDGVTAEQAKRFVGINSQRYVPKFALLNKSNRVSWNWAAFLFPCGWFLSRKMYINGIIAGVLSIISSLLSLPFYNAVYSLGIDSNLTIQQQSQIIYENMSRIGSVVVAFATASIVLGLLIRVISSLFADYSYKKHTISSVKAILEESDDLDFSYRKKGGVSVLMFLIGTIAVQYLPSIIATFI